MKNTWIWILLGAAAVYFLMRSRGGNVFNLGPPTQTTGTASTPNPFWQGWNDITSIGLRNTSANTRQTGQNIATTVNTGVNAALSLYQGISSLFGSSTRAQGPVTNPSTSGSGAGIPTGSYEGTINSITNENTPIVDTNPASNETGQADFGGYGDNFDGNYPVQ